jgi:glutathione S-transferase
VDKGVFRQKSPLAWQNTLAMTTAYAWLDKALSGREWAVGDTFSLADCAAAPSLFYADWSHPIDRAFATCAPIGSACSCDRRSCAR